jgi:acetoin utilization protein AcuB
MIVDEIMTTTLVTISSDDFLGRVSDIFSRTLFHHLLVIEDQRLVGVLTDRDLFKALSPNIGRASETSKDLATLRKHAHQIMTRNPITLASGAHVYDAIKILNANRFSCLPIIDNKNKPIGILTTRDILCMLEKKLLADQTQATTD